MVALIVLIVIGGATRVMEAGLSCPDWPLCYGSFFPKGRMNVQVFLEWVHRLDAFFVGIAIAAQFLLSFSYRLFLPRWVPFLNGFLCFLILLQGFLGGLTVIDLLPSTVVMMHLLLALTLLAIISGMCQILLSPNSVDTPFWWKLLSRVSLIAVVFQTLIGSRMATTWSAQRCISNGVGCYLLDLHKASAIPVAFCVVSFVITAICMGGWFRAQWPLLLSVFALLIMQIVVGTFSMHFNLIEPFTRVAHQLIASLLVGTLAALSCRRPIGLKMKSISSSQDNLLEVCHG